MCFLNKLIKVFSLIRCEWRGPCQESQYFLQNLKDKEFIFRVPVMIDHLYSRFGHTSFKELVNFKYAKWNAMNR